LHHPRPVFFRRRNKRGETCARAQSRVASEIVRDTDTDIKNNSMHTHQPYDDKSRINGARAAYPSTSGWDTRPPRPLGIPPSGPHYIPVADVARCLQRACGSMIPRHRPNRRHEWRLWASKEIYRQFMIADLPRLCLLLRDRAELLYSSLFCLLIDTPFIARVSLSPGF